MDECCVRAAEPCCEGRQVNTSIPRRELRISALNRGYLVNLDCHSFAFETLEKMLTYLQMYLRDPTGTEKKWFEGKLFNE